jgi:hypothetical protein
MPKSTVFMNRSRIAWFKVYESTDYKEEPGFANPHDENTHLTLYVARCPPATLSWETL